MDSTFTSKFVTEGPYIGLPGHNMSKSTEQQKLISDQRDIILNEFTDNEEIEPVPSTPPALEYDTKME
jgi:hypothetical protein